jgi:transcriptional regulator with XRE-family HTH domain
MPQRRRGERPALIRQIFLSLRDRKTQSQEDWGAHLGISAKTVSRWESGFRLPTRGQAMEIILKLRDKPNVNRALLEELAIQYALDPDEWVPSVAAPVSTPPPPAPRPSSTDLRAIAESALFAAAEREDAPARALRATVLTVLGAVEKTGCTIAELKAALAPIAKKGKAT